MTETPPLAVKPAHVAALTPEGRQTFTDGLLKAGYKADAIAAAMDATPPAVVPPKPVEVSLGLAGGPTVGSLEAERAAGMKAALGHLAY